MEIEVKGTLLLFDAGDVDDDARNCRPGTK